MTVSGQTPETIGDGNATEKGVRVRMRMDKSPFEDGKRTIEIKRSDLHRDIHDIA